MCAFCALHPALLFEVFEKASHRNGRDAETLRQIAGSQGTFGVVKQHHEELGLLWSDIGESFDCEPILHPLFDLFEGALDGQVGVCLETSSFKSFFGHSERVLACVVVFS